MTVLDRPVAADLEQRLAARFTRAGLRDGAGTPAPRVVALGRDNHVGWEWDPDGAAPAPAPVLRDANVHLTSQAVLIGPWGWAPSPQADGDRPACGHCLAIRWQRLRPRHERDVIETADAVSAAGRWPLLPDHLVDAVWACYRSALVSRAPAGPAPAGGGRAGSGPVRVTRLDTRRLLVTTVRLLPDGRCPSCGPRAGRGPADDPQAAALGRTSRPKPAPDRFRQRAPGEYRLNPAALANSVCGAIGGGTAAVVTSPTTAPIAGTALVRGPRGLHELTWSGQANSFAASTHLAYIEGLERYAGSLRRRGELVLGSYDELGDRALDPRACGAYPPAAYRADPHLVRFDPSRPVPWVTGRSLRDQRPVLVPLRLAYYGWGGERELFAFECSSGCASGGSPEEAILFGLLELIERDAFLLGWYGGAELPEIDPGAAGPTARAMIDRAWLRGYRVRLFDNRIDLPVPVVTGVACREDGGDGLLSFASAAGFEPSAAVEGALNEILTYIPNMAGQVRTRRSELEAMARDYSQVEALRDHAQLFGLPEMAPHAARYTRSAGPRPMTDAYRDWERERPAHSDLRDDVGYLVGLLAGRGFDTIVVDQTAPEQRAAGLASVRVIVPGLLPIDFGWSRQRALTMPRLLTAYRQAGWREHDLAPGDLHLVPHPFP
jgi:ribosomal protein S12 methylthiotransferase accessory factor